MCRIAEGKKWSSLIHLASTRGNSCRKYNQAGKWYLNLFTQPSFFYSLPHRPGVSRGASGKKMPLLRRPVVLRTLPEKTARRPRKSSGRDAYSFQFLLRESAMSPQVSCSIGPFFGAACVLVRHHSDGCFFVTKHASQAEHEPAAAILRCRQENHTSVAPLFSGGFSLRILVAAASRSPECPSQKYQPAF